MGTKRLPYALLLVLILVLSACTRAASPSVAEETPPFPVPDETGEFPPMDILATAAAATQTAQAEPKDVDQPTEQAPVTTEEVPAATATPEPTAMPEPTTEATEPEEAAECESP